MPDPTLPPRHRRARGLDPSGKLALFETPVIAAEDTIRAGEHKTGRDALFSNGPRTAGTVLVECSTCAARSRVGLGDIALRLASLSVWAPLFQRTHPHRIKCPACNRTTWCRIGWGE